MLDLELYNLIKLLLIKKSHLKIGDKAFLFWVGLIGYFGIIALYHKVEAETDEAFICTLNDVICENEQYTIETIKVPQNAKESQKEAIQQADRAALEELVEYEGHLANLQDWEIERFKRIIDCESKWNPNATNVNNHGNGKFSTDKGILQLNNFYWSYDENKIFNPQYNLQYAFNVIYPKQGFEAWYCSKLIK